MNITIQTWLEMSKQVSMRRRLKDTIQNNLVPINQLSRESKKTVIRQAKILVFQMGSYLFKKGDNDNYIFYLLEGKVVMEATDRTTIAIYGGTKRAMNPISGKTPREYSARAASVVKVLKLERRLIDTVLLSAKYH